MYTTLYTQKQTHITYSIDILHVVGGSIGAMTLEGEVVFGVGGVDVLNGHAAFNATQCKSCGGTCLFVQEYTHTPMLSRQKKKKSVPNKYKCLTN